MIAVIILLVVAGTLAAIGVLFAERSDVCLIAFIIAVGFIGMLLK